MFNQKSIITTEQIVAAVEKFSVAREEAKKLICDINPVELVTPTNLNEVKKDWIATVTNDVVFKNPVFEYDKDLMVKIMSKRPALKDHSLTLHLLRPEASAAAEWFVWEQINHAINDAIDTTLLAEYMSRGDDKKSMEIILRKYGFPGDRTHADALAIALSNLSKNALVSKMTPSHHFSDDDMDILKEDKTLDAEAIGSMFQWAMSQYGDNTWEIDISPAYSAIDVRDKSHKGHPIIAIPEKRRVSGIRLAELIGHEVECHWRSSINAELIGSLKSDNELVYEGLAVTKDKAFESDYIGEFQMNNIYYIIAMREAATGYSFADVAKYIYSFLPESTANRVQKTWTYTYRVFRGICDSRNFDGYAFTKDRAYFEGYQYAQKLEKEGLGTYLNFSTLSPEVLEQFIAITNVKDIKKHVQPDLGIQAESVERILKKLKYGHTQAAGLII